MEIRFLINEPAFQDAAKKYILADAEKAELSLKFRIYYQLFRPFMPIALRQRLQGSRSLEVSESWCEPDRFMNMLRQCVDDVEAEMRIVHPWPDGADFGFILTHDVETAEGLKQIPAVAHIEEELGFRSSWNVIPYKYKIDMGLIKDLQSRGFEIGIHGYNHDGQLYRSHRTFQRRAVAINDALIKYDAVGFRSPMVHRSLEWLQQLDIDYDASCFDVDPLQAMPGGVGSLWPFIAGKFVELPYTLPQDHTLFIALGCQNGDVWRRKLDSIVKSSGMALMLTHPDYLILNNYLDLYRDFLRHVRDRGGFWHALPREAASWWRQREAFVKQHSDVATRSDWVRQPDDHNIVQGRLRIGPECFRITSSCDVDSMSP